MESNRKREMLWSRDYVVLMLACTGISFCNYFFFSTLPIYAARLTGTTAASGLMTGAYTLAALAARPFSGLLSDRIGRTRMLILGALGCGLCCLFYTLPAAIGGILMIRALHGVGFSLHSTAGGAVAADIVPKARMAEGIGIFGLYGTIAAAVAPGIGLALIGTGEASGFRLLFLLAAATSLVSLICDCCIGYERHHGRAAPPPAAHDAPRTGVWLGFDAAVFPPAVVVVLLFIGLSSINTFLALFALERGIGNVGLFFTVNAAGLFLARIVLGRVADRHGADIILIPSIAALALCYVAIPFAHTLPTLLAISFPLGLAQGAAAPTLNTLIFQRCAPQRRGTASAAYFSAIDLGYGCGSILFGVIVAWAGYVAIYLCSAASTALALAYYVARASERRQAAGKARGARGSPGGAA